MITPNILRLGNQETVVLEAHGMKENIAVTVTVHDFPAKKQVLANEKTDLTSNNDYMSTVTISVGVPADAQPSLSLLAALSPSHFGAHPSRRLLLQLAPPILSPSPP